MRPSVYNVYANDLIMLLSVVFIYSTIQMKIQFVTVVDVLLKLLWLYIDNLMNFCPHVGDVKLNGLAGIPGL